MQLSSKARKGLAAGLAASTVLMSSAASLIPAAFAAPHADGCLVNISGTVYMNMGGQRRGFPSPDVFFSHGNGFGGVQSANAEDIALPVGPVMVYADGTLVKGPNDPLVYLVTNGQKRPFVSGEVFTGLGFKFSNIQSAPANTFADLPTGANLESATERHGAGVWVIDSTGTVWRMTATGRQGLPTMAVFNSYGKSFATVVSANAADLATSNEGVVAAKASCTSTSTPTTGSMSISAAGPASSTLVTGQSAADLAHFAFSGSGTVTSLTFERIGVSENATLSSVYLFDGAARLTDAATVGSDGKVTFSSAGLFTVSGSKTITVKSDILSGSQGQVVGVKLASYTVSGGSATTVSVSGNTHTIASATLATGTFGAVTSVGTTPNPGNDLNLWQSTLTANTRDVLMNRLSLRKVGSINNSDLVNLRLQIAGTTVASASGYNSDGYVTFSFAPVTITTSGKTVRLIGDLLGGATRTFNFQLVNKSDIGLVDSSFNVGTTITNTPPLSSSTATVQAGALTVVKANGSPSSDVTKGATDVPVASYTFSATGGEAVKVESLAVGIDTSLTDTDVTFRNVRLMINGLQVGSTNSVPAEDFGTVVETGTSFTTNFTISPGTPVTVEVRADMHDSEGTNDLADGTTFTVSLIADVGSDNATALTSSNLLGAPTANLAGNTLTVKVGSMSLTKQANYTDRTTTVPQTAYKIGAYNLTGSSAEDINVTEMTVAFNVTDADTFDSSDDLSSLYVKYGSSTSSVKSTVSDTSNVYSTAFTLMKNSVVPIEIYANIGSTITAADDLNATLIVSGNLNSGATVNTGSAVAGQNITVGAGSVASAVSASSPVKALLSSNSSAESARFEISAVNDSFTVTEATVALDADADGTFGEASQDLPTALTTVTLGGQTKPAAETVTFTGLSLAVPANGLVEIPVTIAVGSIGSGAGATGQKVTTRLTGFKHTSSLGTSTTVSSLTLDGNPMYAYKAVPIVTTDSSMPTTLGNTNVVLAKFTVGSQGGTIGWKKIIFTVTKAANPVVTNATVWDVTTNTEVAGAATLTTVGATNTSGSIAFVATNEQQVASNHTYELRADVASSGTGDSISTRIANPSTYAASAAYATVAATTASFVWTDRSATSHGVGTLDWVNDYTVKTLPTTLQTVSR